MLPSPRRSLASATATRLAGLVLCALSLAGPASATSPEPDAGAMLQGQQPMGAGLLRVWGFEVYQARLWAAPGFDPLRFDRTPFSLELDYRRAFQGRDIARRSIEEMSGLMTLEPEQAQRWLTAMGALFPDVQPGDRILGVHRPGQNAAFYLNGRLLGEIADPAFSARFFAIWLSPRTSQPALRDALLAQLRP